MLGNIGPSSNARQSSKTIVWTTRQDLDFPKSGLKVRRTWTMQSSCLILFKNQTHNSWVERSLCYWEIDFSAILIKNTKPLLNTTKELVIFFLTTVLVTLSWDKSTRGLESSTWQLSATERLSEEIVDHLSLCLDLVSCLWETTKKKKASSSCS